MPARTRPIIVLLSALAIGCGPTAADVPSPDQPPSPSPVVAADLATASPSSTVMPSTEPVPADLDGMLTTSSLAHRLPLAVSIDDSRAARPQSGFNAASVVWQAPVDGYETRYLLVFQELDASAIGPVRSARTFLAVWSAELAAGLAHYGGDALSRTWMQANRGRLFTDIDGLGAGNPAYHRISSREAPNNAYTSTAELWRVAERLGGAAEISAGVHLRPFRDDSPSPERGTSQSIAIPYNTVRVGYRYDATENAYRRQLNGAPQVDPMDGQPVWARTVVVLFMPFRTDSTIEPGHNRPVLGFVGSGKALVFMEGRVVSGRWSKPHENDPTVILGPDGSELPFIRGRIFFQVVPTGTKITS